MKRVKCFTHNDLDGFGTNIIFKYLENENNNELKADVINCSYDNINNNVMEYFNNKVNYIKLILGTRRIAW